MKTACFITAIGAVLGLAWSAWGQALEVELEDLRPGLLAVYRSAGDPKATLARLDVKPAFTLGHSSPHPRLPAGPFEVSWTGVLFFKEIGPVSFHALVCGDLSIEVDGQVVLTGRGETETDRLVGKHALDRPPGLYRLKITYRSLPDRPARLQIGWQGKAFSAEPVPAWLFKHLATDLTAAAQQDQLAERGRAAVTHFGCARCHAEALPGVHEPPPGPALHDVGRRLDRRWLLNWLADPAAARPDARMPALFAANRQGEIERWLVADYLLGKDDKPAPASQGDHRMGRRHFIGIGCAACHFVPDLERAEQVDLERRPLTQLGDRYSESDLAAFLGQPHGRYPDGRMPRLPLTPDMARDIAAFLLLWSKPTEALADVKAPTPEEIAVVTKRLGARGQAATAVALIREKRCGECHPGIGPSEPARIPIAKHEGCLTGQSGPRFVLNDDAKKSITAFLAVAGQEKHPSPFADRQRQLERAGCVRCHQRDSDRPPPLETIGSTLGSAWLQNVPFQRTPRLTYPHQKYLRGHLVTAVRDGVSGLRPGRYTYRMPSFGAAAETLVQALAEGDGELPAGPEPPARPVQDPTLATLHGAALAGFTGYACVSCHMWNGQMLSEPDPGAVAPELTRVAGRLRPDWFGRFLEDPARSHPNTPMPAVFPRGKPATLTALDAEPARQTEALWQYLALGKAAPNPKPPPPLVVSAPLVNDPALVAQIPIRPPEGKSALEALCVLTGQHDLLIYDLGVMAPRFVLTGGQILRQVQGRLRSYGSSGTVLELPGESNWTLGGQSPTHFTLHGYDRLADGARLRWRGHFPAGDIEAIDSVRFDAERRLVREVRLTGIPDQPLELRCRPGEARPIIGGLDATATAGVMRVTLKPVAKGGAAFRVAFSLPAAEKPVAVERTTFADSGTLDPTLPRPGYTVTAFPRPRTSAGDDLVMPGALAVHPRDGRLFIASMKLGEVFVVRSPAGDLKDIRYDNFARGLYQEAFSMLAEPDGLYVLHRRNLTRLVDHDNDGVADRFDRVVGLNHGIADSYDYAYGLARDRDGAFVISYAPHANHGQSGSGGALRLKPGQPPRESGYGFRNPVGWCAGPDGEVFFTDNQGEWVATNKLCHLEDGKFYGYPNPSQRQHASLPMAKTAIWVPYGWARSLNGVAYDHTGGAFGPFAGQIFMAELMYGGAIIRANLEKVNGTYQGACFPFWGKGLMGPVSLAFDPKGRLYVGGITEPGWMAQPDRGAVFRIDYTGQTPFEMQSIHVLPGGFRIQFTTPVAAEAARDAASYLVEHYRYEYTGAYGSPELDRAKVKVERVEVSADGRTVDITTSPLVKERVYLITPRGVRSAKGETLVHPTGAYTLNEIPAKSE